MNLSSFQQLTDSGKIETIYKEGIYIGKKKEHGLTVLLFQVESFYVEVFYKKYRCAVVKLDIFTSASFLDPYLDEMPLEHIVYAP